MVRQVAVGVWLGLAGCGQACGGAESASPQEVVRPSLRVVGDRVISRGPGFEAKMTLPALKGVQDRKLARGVSAWLQRGPRTAMAAWREEASRQGSSAAPWTLEADFEVTHDGPRYLSIVQRVHTNEAGVQETVRSAVTLERETLSAVSVGALLAAFDVEVGATDGDLDASQDLSVHLTRDAIVRLGPTGEIVAEWTRTGRR